MSTNHPEHVCIIGGGVIGCSIAYQLSKAGVRVSVIERAEIAAEASSAAAGLLAPGGVLTGPKTGADLFLASWSITADLIAEIEAASGIQVEYHRIGALHTIMDAYDELQMRKYAEVWLAQGQEVTWLRGNEVRQYEPLLDSISAGRPLRSTRGEHPASPDDDGLCGGRPQAGYTYTW